MIATCGDMRRWVKPWYGAYAILGALAGVAVIDIPLVVINGHGSATAIGTTIAAQNFGALFAPFWGMIADRTKTYRAVFFLGFILIGLGFLGLSLLRGLPVWTGSAFLIGFGAGASNTIACLFVIEFTPKTEWGQRISWMQTFNAFGTVLGMAVAGLLAPKLDTLLAACMVIPAILIGSRGLPVPAVRLACNPRNADHPSAVRRRFDVSRQMATAPELHRLLHRAGLNAMNMMAHLRRPSLSAFHALRRPLASRFTLFLLAWFLLSLAVSSFSSLYPILMEKSFSVSVLQSSLLISISTALSIPLYSFAGRIVTKRGPNAALAVGTTVRMIGLLGLAVIGFRHATWAWLPVVILIGIFQWIWPLLSVASNDLAAGSAPFGEGAAMGIFNAVAAIASAAGAVLGGKVADGFGYPAVSLFAGSVAALALACMIGLMRRSSTIPVVRA